ncbi:MAG: EF-hand domain-containing protein [Bacteroidota bacterium]
MKSQILKTVWIGSLLIIFGVTTSFAQQGGQKQRQKRPTTAEIFQQMDANEDGKLSQKEAKGPIQERFTEIDTNEDGYITEEELHKAPKPQGRRSDG